jgi:hypothetical protein
LAETAGIVGGKQRLYEHCVLHTITFQRYIVSCTLFTTSYLFPNSYDMLVYLYTCLYTSIGIATIMLGVGLIARSHAPYLGVHRVHVYVHAHVHVCVCVNMYMYLHMDMCMCTHMRTHMYMRAYMRAHMHICVHACIHTYTHTYIHTYMHS